MGLFGSKLDLKHDPQQTSRHKREGCVFCNIASKAASSAGHPSVIFQNERLMVIPDKCPAARHHLLVIPLEHVANTNILRPEDLALLDEMAQVGRAVLLTRMALDQRYDSVSKPTHRGGGAGAGGSSSSNGASAAAGRHGAAAPGSANGGATAHGSDVEAGQVVLDMPLPDSRRQRLLEPYCKFGYHVPPFRSVDHLHPPWKTLKYTLRGVWLPSDQLRERLLRDDAAP